MNGDHDSDDLATVREVLESKGIEQGFLVGQKFRSCRFSPDRPGQSAFEGVCLRRSRHVDVAKLSEEGE